MGKSLIIPGADFSANAIEREIEWYLDDSVFDNPEIEWVSYLIRNNAYILNTMIYPLKNKTINILKVRKNPNVVNATIVLYHIGDDPQTFVEGASVNVIETRTILITNEGVSTYQFEPIVLSSNESILISSGSDDNPEGRGAMRYSTGSTVSYVMNCSTTVWNPASSHGYFEINFGYNPL